MSRAGTRAVAVATAVLMTVTACSTSDGSSDGTGDGTGDSSRSSMQPSDAPAPAVTPAEISPQWRTVEGPDFTIGIPQAFTDEVVTVSNGTKAHVFDAPGSEPDSLERVAVLRDENPTSDVIQQSFVLEEMQSVSNEDEVKRAEVTWPGAERAVLVRWTNPVAGSEGKRGETWQLMAQINDDLILNVVAISDDATFEESELPVILETFKGR